MQLKHKQVVALLQLLPTLFFLLQSGKAAGTATADVDVPVLVDSGSSYKFFISGKIVV